MMKTTTQCGLDIFDSILFSPYGSRREDGVDIKPMELNVVAENGLAYKPDLQFEIVHHGQTAYVTSEENRTKLWNVAPRRSKMNLADQFPGWKLPAKQLVFFLKLVRYAATEGFLRAPNRSKQNLNKPADIAREYEMNTTTYYPYHKSYLKLGLMTRNDNYELFVLNPEYVYKCSHYKIPILLLLTYPEHFNKALRNRLIELGLFTREEIFPEAQS